MWVKQTDYLQKYHLLIIAIAVLATVAGSYFSSKLRLESDLAKLLPGNYESVKTMERIQDTVGGQGNIRIVIETAHLAKAEQFANDLAAKLRQNQDVNFVDYKNDVSFYKKYALLFLSLSELDSLKTAIQDKINFEKQKLNPLYVENLFGEPEASQDTDLTKWEERYQDKEPKEYYTNTDSSALVMDVYPAGTSTSLAFVRQVLKEVKRTADDLNPQQYSPDMRVLYGGNFKNRLDEYEVVSKDILGTAYIGFSGVFLLILFYFRRLTAAVLITITLLMSLTWTFGVTYLVIGRLNTITGFLFVILFGLGIDYGIHALSRYSESRRAGLTLEESLGVIIGPTARALATSALTTVVAFYSLMIMDFKGFSELGFISGTGIVFALAAMVVLLPAFIIVAEKFKLLNFKISEQDQRSLRDRKFPFPRATLLFSALLTLFSIYSLSQLQFEYDFTNLRPELPERKEVGEKTKGVFDLSESPAIVLADSPQDLQEIDAAVQKIIREDTLSPTVKTVKSIYSFVPQDQQQKLQTIAEIRKLIDREAEGMIKGKDKELLDRLQGYLQVNNTFSLQDLPKNLKRRFTDKEGKIGNFAFIYPSVLLRDGKNAIEFRNDIGKITTQSGKTFYASSSNIIFADMLTLMIREGKLAVLLTFGVVFLVVLLDFRNLKETLLVLTPLLVGVLWMIGAMYIFRMKLNFFNMVVLPSVIGIGVDHGVHIYHRYKEEGMKSVVYILRHTGFAISMCSATTLVGYSGLIMARHPGLNSIGDLAVIGISSTFLTAIIVLPALLQFMENRRATGKQDTTKPEAETILN